VTSDIVTRDPLTRDPVTRDPMRGERMLECHVVGRVLLVLAGAPDRAQVAFAAGLAEDPEHTVVILDLAPDYSGEEWEAALRVLAHVPGSLRLVPWRPRPGGLVAIGQWLAGVLGRTVLAQDGQPVVASGGALFVSPGVGTGWLRLEPGRPPASESRRFPRPRWTAAMPFERPAALSPATVLQPLPGGAWLYPDAVGESTERYGRWLCANLAWSHDTINVVLGYPGAPPVPVADVARIWSALPDAARQNVRFVPFGEAGAIGQELADAIGHRVELSTGIPVSGWRAGSPVRVAVLSESGAFCWEPLAAEISYFPGGTAPLPKAAVLPPGLGGLAEQSPSVYALEPGIVMEVVRSGLWLRPDPVPVDMGVRCRPPDPDCPVLWVDDAIDAAADETVRRLLGALPPPSPRARWQARPVTAPDTVTNTDTVPDTVSDTVKDTAHPKDPVPERVMLPAIRLESGPPDTTPVPGPVVVPDEPAEPVTAVPAEDAGEEALLTVRENEKEAATEQPAAVAGSVLVRVQPVPAPQASAVPPPRGIAQERQWLRRTMSQQFGDTSSLVSRVLSQTPGLRGGGDGASHDVLTDLVAVRLYLAGHGQRIDDAVRTGEVGPHVPFARCVAAGLRRLPSYRGATRLCATIEDAEWQWYESRRLVTEWAFCPALTDGAARLPGDVDFLIWSMTARRTSLLAPDVASQVVFLPGTSFKVLRVREGERREVLLRELSASEIAADGRVETGQVPLDDLALAGLEKAMDAWAHADASGELPREFAWRFGNPPGLNVSAAEPGALAGARTGSTETRGSGAT
jgi:hypothetical protein